MEKKKMGRPKGKRSDSAIVYLRLDRELKQRFQAAAEETHLSLNTFIRLMAMRGLQSLEKEWEEKGMRGIM